MSWNPIDAMLDAAIAGRPKVMCAFPINGPLGDIMVELYRPLPKRFREEDGEYVLDYEGSFVSGYEWRPWPRYDARFEEWYDFGE